MATLNGAIRSYGAAVRRMERNQQRQAREAAKRFKEQQKQQLISDTAQAVNDYNSYVRMLQSVHQNCTEAINWAEIKIEPKPYEPTKNSVNEDAAQKKLMNFKPSFFDKIFGSTQKKILRLKIQLDDARTKDNKNYELAVTKFQKDLNDWQELQKIANGVEKQNAESYIEALEYFNPFDDIGELGSQIEFKIIDNFIDIDFFTNDKDVIPDYEISQTSTGKMSKKAIPKTKFNELHQDHICSCAIRIAREAFAYLPVNFVRINAISKMLNAKTGHLENQPILSVLFPPETIEKLNLNKIDPSDSMENFVHNMNFKKTTGFVAIEKVSFK